MRGVLMAALLAVVLSGCDSTADPAGGSSRSDAPGPLIRIEKDSRYVMTALLIGRLHIDHGCLVLKSPQNRALLVWPASARWDPGARTVEAADGSVSIPIGGHVNQGGGFYESPTEISFRLSPESFRRLRACARSTGLREIAKIEPLAAD